MLYNYLKVTFRNIWRSKVNSFINIIGLSVGIASAILIVLFVKDELTFDRFHSKIDRLYRVTTSISRDGDGEMEGMTPFVIGSTIKDEIQDIEAAINHTSYSDMVEHGETKFRETITVVGAEFFKMFDFKVLDGSINNALTKVSDVIITREMAEKYFGEVAVTGETIRISAGGELKDYQIVAVLDNLPSNSSFQFNFLVGDENLKFLFAERQLNHYFMIAGEVYVLLREGVTPEEVEAKIPAMVEKGLGEEMYSRVHYKNGLQPMADIHLGPQMNSLVPISDPNYTM
ncbi:MAG: ABC transporter permease, partial [Bacteroidota bacterium]